jgi:hypothetical protein
MSIYIELKYFGRLDKQIFFITNELEGQQNFKCPLEPLHSLGGNNIKSYS